ncbi:MAG: NUDIX domain-containing protein [Candidatus Woesearchaeota archaeon]
MEISAGGIIFNTEKKVVIVEQKHKTYSFPKGHLKINEKLLNCAYREIYEETGIFKQELKFIRKLGFFKRRCSKTDKIKRIHLYLFKTNKKELKPLDIENPSAFWVNFDDVGKILTHKEDILFFSNKFNTFLKEK